MNFARFNSAVVYSLTFKSLLFNRDHISHMSYRISDSNCGQKDAGIQVDTSGNVWSSQTLCHATLHVTSVDEIGGHQSFSSLVLVRFLQ